MNNPYSVLGIQPGASEKQISKAYRSLALLHHPDKSASPQSAELFQRATEAYKRLMDPSGREEEERRVREAEERKRRREEMSEHRKQLQKDLLERERAVSNGKASMSSCGVMSKSSATNANGKNTTTSSATTSPSFSTTTPSLNPANPKFALLLKVSSASCPLPLTPETLSASLNLSPERIILQSSVVCAEFASAKDAAEVLAKIPFDAVRSGDWYLGYPPVELFEAEEVVDGTDHNVRKKVKVTEEFESEVLKRLRELAKSKK